MKIAAIMSSGGLNQGNDFINFGGQTVVERLNPESEIEYFEFYDSCLPQWKTKEIFTQSTIDYIRNNFDIIYMFQGSGGSPVIRDSVFKPVNDIGLPIIVLGLGCGGVYDSGEMQAMNDIHNLCNVKKLITRDSKAYGFLEDNTKAYSGIDLAFFAKDTIKPRKENSGANYAVVNYEPHGLPTELSGAYDLKKQLEEHYDPVYIVENNVNPSDTRIDNFVQIGYAKELWNFYANASYVVTTRVHSAICCVSSGVKFTYLGADNGGKKGRNCLFNEIGLTLITGDEYDGKDYLDKIDEAKENYIKNVREFINE